MTSPLAADWQAWLAENVLRGAPDDDLLHALTQAGMPESEAAGRVAEVRNSPLIAGARRLLARSAGVEQAARLRRALAPRTLERRATLDADAFHRDFWCHNRPVRMPAAVKEWPAMGWTFEAWAKTLGDVEVQAMVGRTTVDGWMHHREALNTLMPLSDLLDKVQGTAGDDVYCVARNDFLERDGLQHLQEDLGLLPGVRPGHAKLWLGPADTLTPLHHDQSSAWFVQLIGRKEVWLASNLEPALMATAQGVYNRVDPRDPSASDGELAEVTWLHTVLEPGDAIFIPAGWWHQLVAKEASVSVSFGGFRWPNAFPWYAPNR